MKDSTEKGSFRFYSVLWQKHLYQRNKKTQNDNTKTTPKTVITQRLQNDLGRSVGEKGRDLTQSCDKNPYTHRTIQKATWQHKNATKNFDYTTIADRLRTVSWSNSSHPTGVVKPVYERSTFPLTATAV